MKPINVYSLQFLSAAIPLALAQVYSAGASHAEVLSRPVPAERIRWIPELIASQSPATLHVIRESRWQGWAVPVTLFIDGKEVAAIKDGENLMLRIPPGPHSLGLKYASQDPLSAPPAAYARGVAYYELAHQFAGGKYHDFKIVPDARWNWQLDREKK